MATRHPLAVVEIKAFVPAKDFELSKRFYKDIGFTMAAEGGGVAYFHFEHASFLLQDCVGISPTCTSGGTMKIVNTKDILQVTNTDLSGSDFNNANLAGTLFDNVCMARCRLHDIDLSDTAMTNLNLTNVSISRATMGGMTIDGILVTDLFSAYRSRGSQA